MGNIVLLGFPFFGLVVGFIAKSNGRRFWVWFLYGFFLTAIALMHITILINTVDYNAGIYNAKRASAKLEKNQKQDNRETCVIETKVRNNDSIKSVTTEELPENLKDNTVKTTQKTIGEDKKENLIEIMKRSNEDIGKAKAREEKEKEYKVFMQAHGSLPTGFTAIENTIEKHNYMSTVNYDGDGGDFGEAFIVKYKNAIIDVESLQKLIEWKKAQLNFDSSYQWKVLSAVYAHWIQTPENDEYKKPTLILSDSRPSIKAKMKEALKDANITFIYMISDTSYYDWLEEKVYGYDYQTYAGSVDDAATYCYWEKKVIADGYKATQMLNAAIKARKQEQ